MERDDIVLGTLLLVGAVAIGATAIDATQGFQPETELERYCAGVADKVEGNYTSLVESCRCVPPDQVDQERYEQYVPSNVSDISNLFLVQCELTDGETFIYPVWRIQDGAVNGTNTSGFDGGNASVLNGTN